MPGTESDVTTTEETCTCKQCIDGWLSPRMKERLEGEADFLRYVSWQLLEDLLEVPEDEVIPDWCIAANAALHYIPTELHLKMTPAFYRGYMLVVEAVLRILVRDEPGNACVPTPAAVRAELDAIAAFTPPPDDAQAPLTAAAQEADAVRAFLGAGGQVEFALEALTDRAMEKSPEGAEYGRREAWREEEDEFQEEVRTLPQCMHDLDFELVRTHLGLPAKSIGPHWFFLTDDEDSDEDGGEEAQSDEEAVYEGQQAAIGKRHLRRQQSCLFIKESEVQGMEISNDIWLEGGE